MFAAHGHDDTTAKPVAEGRGPTRERLIDAAWELLGEGGADAVTLRGVGARTGVSRTAPYRHFQDKEDLLRSVAARGFDLLRERIAVSLGAVSGTPEEIRALCRTYITFALEHPNEYRLMFGEWVLSQKHGQDPRADDLRSATHRMFAFCHAVVERGLRNGEIRAGDPDELMVLTWSTMHGLVTFALAQLRGGGPAPASDTVVDRLIGQVVEGLRP